jgi:pimeloyl-ACP methyl ester carboxylesterase
VAPPDDRPVFVLVHGAWHGGWCWDPLVAELARRDVRAIAVDLPADDVDAGATAYAQCVLDRVAGERDVVVVGHSLGGLTIPLVAARRPVRALVFLCALMPVPGLTVGEQRRDAPDMFVPGFAAATRPDAHGRSYWPDRDAAIADLYQDADRAQAEAAYARLRPQAARPGSEPSPLETWPAVPSVVITAADDRAISPAWVSRSARARLGLDALVLPGGHSPFLSRPDVLADLLLAETQG